MSVAVETPTVAAGGLDSPSRHQPGLQQTTHTHTENEEHTNIGMKPGRAPEL